MNRTTHLCLLPALLLVSSLCAKEAPAQKRGRTSAIARQQSATPLRRATPMPLAVTPFHQTIGTTDTALLEFGITDSLTNSLKNAAGLSVADSVDVREIAEQLGTSDTRKEVDALKLGQRLGVEVLVTGNYQIVGTQLIIDAKLLTIRAGRILPGQALRVNGLFPANYPAILNQLNSKITQALNVSVTPAEKSNIEDVANATQSPEAREFYHRGLQKLNVMPRTQQTLTEARDLFNQAWEKDRNFADAVSSLSETENLIAKLKMDGGENADQERKDAIDHAQSAVNSRPKSGRGYRRLGDAYATEGDYPKAADAYRHVTALWKSDADAFLALARALGNGEPGAGKELENALRLGPWLKRLVQIPVVLVVNKTPAPLDVTIGDQNKRIAANSQGTIMVTPGSHPFAVSGFSRWEGTRVFVASETWTIGSSAFPVGSLAVANHTNGTISLRLSNGNKLGSRSMNIGIGKTDSLTLFSGSYSYQGSTHGFPLSGTVEIVEGHKTTLGWKESDVPKGVLVVKVNSNQDAGGLSVPITISGPVNRSFSVRVGSSHSVVVPPGNYSISIEVANGGDTQQIHLAPGTKEIIPFDVIVTHRRP